MYAIMQNKFNTIRDEIGLKDKDNVEEDDRALEQVLQTLKTNSTAANFKEFMTPTQMVNKATPWKQIARKVNQEVDLTRKFRS